MSLVCEYATAASELERERTLELLLRHASASGGTLHESFHADDPSDISRPVFGWVNALFARYACSGCFDL